MAALVGGIFVALIASDDEGVVLCPFRRCTDGYCPLCGATRAAGKLVRGDVLGAWHRHPVLVLWVLQAVVLGAVMAWRRATSRPALALRGFITANLVLMLGVWMVRLGLHDIPRPSTLSFFGF